MCGDTEKLCEAVLRGDPRHALLKACKGSQDFISARNELTRLLLNLHDPEQNDVDSLFKEEEFV